MKDLRSALFDIDISGGEPRAGSLLVAEPFLNDAPFKHGVILLVDHDSKDHSMGVVINKSTGYTLHDLVEEIDSDAPVFNGGPVGKDRLIYIHSLGDILPGSTPVAPGLWLGGDFDELKQYLKSGYPTDGLIRFFLGYSAWQAGQLEEEIADKVWAVVDNFDTKNIFSDRDDTTWHRTVRDMGDRFRGWRFHPLDPSAN